VLFLFLENGKAWKQAEEKYSKNILPQVEFGTEFVVYIMNNKKTKRICVLKRETICLCLKEYSALGSLNVYVTAHYWSVGLQP